MSKVVIRKATYESLTPIIREIFEIFPLDLQGKKVFIKPNLVVPSPPEMAATTHPALIRAIAEEVQRKGGRPGIGDNGIDVQTLYRVTGMEKACGPYMVDISREARLFEIGGYPVPISKFFVDSDIFISVPKLKTHRLAGMTCCLKNSFGLIPANYKARMHALSGHVKRLTEFFVDLYRWRIPDLNIVDGILAMEGEGPTDGKPREVGRIIAGKDGVAVDAVCARMIWAAKKGLVHFDLDRVETEGPMEVIEDFVHPSTYTANTPGKKSSYAANAEQYMEWWADLGRVRPLCNPALCNRCGDCLSACPSGAVFIEPHPGIDPEKCLSCFCCVEVCPEKVFVLPMQELQEKRSRMGM
ncbi:MAG: hypothetical protein AMJ94_05025 [Deltaproteobacteria bacterium SM23_61]|nr:MAG: hypothetical protein AMJ94_05025 [Deltaproteobacteria bacterium SM23_61]